MSLFMTLQVHFVPPSVARIDSISATWELPRGWGFSDSLILTMGDDLSSVGDEWLAMFQVSRVGGFRRVHAPQTGK